MTDRDDITRFDETHIELSRCVQGLSHELFTKFNFNYRISNVTSDLIQKLIHCS